MIDIFGGRNGGFCDGVSRRDFLQVGGAGLAGLSLADLLRAESKTGSSEKSMIHILLPGGPASQDMFDLKPDAPDYIRGDLKPIKTKIPGVPFSELLPNLAGMADKLAIVRSINDWANRGLGHGLARIASGASSADLMALGGRPSQAAAVNKLLRPRDTAVPTTVMLPGSGGGSGPGVYDQTGFLGPRYASFKGNSSAAAAMQLKNITRARLDDRRSLSESLDSMKREADAKGEIAAADTFTQRAFDILTSNKLAKAMNLADEKPQTLERYGTTQSWDHSFVPFTCSYASLNKDLIRCRRLVEAGVRMVALKWGHWDTHWGHFPAMRQQLPPFDIGISALVQDLIDRGLYKNTAVLVWGEFGRTPVVGFPGAANNKNQGPGRQHYGIGMAMILCGGMRMGQVIGETDKLYRNVKDRPFHCQEVLGTMYHHMGLDPRTTQITDPAGRPQYLVERNQPIKELI